MKLCLFLFCLAGFSLYALVPSEALGFGMANAEEDTVEGEDGDVEVEGEEAGQGGADSGREVIKDLDEEPEVAPIGPSPDAETYFLFTEGAVKKDLIAGKLTKVIASLYNKGSEAFVVQGIDCSFRYPMDYSYYIRNYSASVVNRVVEPNVEASFDYAFYPAPDLAGRPFGLTINLNYRNLNGSVFQNALYNETINVLEDETGFNTETGFLIVVGLSLGILLLVLGQQFLQKMRRKHGIMTSSKKREEAVEMGTTGNADVDWEWIPKEVMQRANKSPRPGSPQKSPRQRKTKRED